MKTLLLALCVILCSTSSAKADQEFHPSVFVEATTANDDTVGSTLVYKIKEGVRESKGMTLVSSRENAILTAHLVTLAPIGNDGVKMRNSTVYSAVLTFKDFVTLRELYLDQYVGTCSIKVDQCANGLIAEIDSQLQGIVDAYQKYKKQ